MDGKKHGWEGRPTKCCQSGFPVKISHQQSWWIGFTKKKKISMATLLINFQLAVGFGLFYYLHKLFQLLDISIMNLNHNI